MTNDEVENELGFGTLDRFQNSVGFLELLLEVFVLLLPKEDGDGLGEFEQEGDVGLVEDTVVLLVPVPQDPKVGKDGEEEYEQ